MDIEQAKDVYSEGLMVGRRIGEALAKKELGSLRARIAELEGALRHLTAEVMDHYIECVRQYWGNTNANVLRHWRDEARKILSAPPVSANAENPPASETRAEAEREVVEAAREEANKYVSPRTWKAVERLERLESGGGE